MRRLVLAAIDKQFEVEGIGSFTSTFGKKAHADLIAYEALRAKRAREVDELYTRPFEDLVVEEFISNLPVPTIVEVDEPMDQATGSAEAAPADSPSGEMAGVEEAQQEPASETPMDVDEMPMTLMHQEALPLERYLIKQQLMNQKLRGSLQRVIPMILIVRSRLIRRPRVTREALHWRGTHTRDEFLCRCLQRS